MREIIKSKELYKFIEEDFVHHLEIQDNTRIIFSAKFGKGKTTFLKEFFANQPANLKKQYNYIHLFPVNYSLASIDDIFRYIKYDIIIEFLRKEITQDVFDFTFLEKLEWFAYTNPYKILASLVSFVPKVGHTLESMKSSFEKLKPEFDKWVKEIKGKSPDEAFAEFLNEIELKDGSIYENDFITKSIEKTLTKIKKAETKDKREIENILIIDDLDRIDPEHIFRILNVFAAHFDENQYSHKGKLNKFGFDKVIIVCDYHSLRSIFHHKYGVDTDFIGYVNKFYSVSPFVVKNNVEYLCREIFDTIRLDYQNRNYSTIQGFSFSIDLLQLINGLFRFNYIDLRSIFSIREMDFSKKYNEECYFEGISLQSSCMIPIQLNILIQICGDFENLIKGIHNLKRNGYYVNQYKINAEQLLFLNTVHIHGWTKYNEKEVDYKIENLSVIFKITTINRTSVKLQFFGHIPTANYLTNMSIDNYYDLLLETCYKLKASGYFY